MKAFKRYVIYCLVLRTETLEHFLFQNLSDLMIFRERYRERVEQHQGQGQRINIIRGRTQGGRNIKYNSELSGL